MKKNWWRDLSVVKKLYTVFGIMAFLIGFELLVLSFAMNTISSVRAFVAGEGQWSKAQKDAVNSLHKYIITGDKKYYLNYKNFLEVPLGDRAGLIELEKKPLNWAKLNKELLRGKNHPDDIEGMAYLILRFHDNKYIAEALKSWKAADIELDKLIQLGDEIHQEVQEKNFTHEEIKVAVSKLDVINRNLTILENDFSASLSEGSRWLEKVLLLLLFILVLTVEITGLTFTMTFSRNLSRMLKKMMKAAEKIGWGDFAQRVNINSKDELGQLASSINKMAQELKSNVDLRKQAEESNKAKSLFLANMSHEIRTPLSSIMGFAELLKKTDLSTSEKDRYSDIILNSGESLTNVINDILDISKVESGHLSIDHTDFSLLKLLSDLQNLLRFKCDEKGISLDFKIDENIPDFINTDPIRLRQILLNLLTNSIKFTEKGDVTLSVHERQGQLIFDIHDTGIGIPPHDQVLIFERFRQSDCSLNRKHGGTGLGLPLSKHLSLLLDGDLELISSVQNQGSHFRTCVQYRKATQNEVSPSAETNTNRIDRKNNLSGTKLLIVDDSEDIRLLLNEILSHWGCNLDFAEDGIVAFEKIKNNSYEIILSDIQMPKLNGFELIKKLRGELKIKTPVIAQTAHAMKEERDRCLAEGFDDVLVKPINLEEFIQLLLKYANKPQSSTDASASIANL